MLGRGLEDGWLEGGWRKGGWLWVGVCFACVFCVCVLRVRFACAFVAKRLPSGLREGINMQLAREAMPLSSSTTVISPMRVCKLKLTHPRSIVDLRCAEVLRWVVEVGW